MGILSTSVSACMYFLLSVYFLVAACYMRIHLTSFYGICIGKPYICNSLHPHATRVGFVLNVATFTQFAQSSIIGSLLSLYGSPLHVAIALSPGVILTRV